ncbi:LysE family translocator [Oceanospirillaceae bacterium]|jgi:threonine/homoserine/homoserine lactone efflux protein|uniref:LysE family translocator n=1 Tax=Candidatus Njordibacter sp. Uisw_002 TaxID=3230971 RepID=UPI00236ECA20|nr:LysE family translocator [Oceanospirillaceae bacterium]MDB9973105.1 LysE family translocator [Oceanospirillaceae bacterium]MDC1341012.1 LysE family translocator [Oceanospirillaceae bacterium]|tara:strand:- start:4023 stop:4631 length:609 start_codon:yes stop_codon:yes gene_type:complete
MTLTTWFSLVAICCLGAMSPGPSLAVVLRHTVSNGRIHGVITAITHAIGVALWALLTVWGLALLVVEWPLMYKFLTYAGAAYLMWMGIKALRSNGAGPLNVVPVAAPISEAARDGLMVSLLNPKLAFFFTALFSQFVSAELLLVDKLIMTGTASIIDALWYIIVAVALSHSKVLEKLQRRSALIDKISGVVLLGLALRVVTL